LDKRGPKFGVGNSMMSRGSLSGVTYGGVSTSNLWRRKAGCSLVRMRRRRTRGSRSLDTRRCTTHSYTGGKRRPLCPRLRRDGVCDDGGGSQRGSPWRHVWNPAGFADRQQRQRFLGLLLGPRLGAPATPVCRGWVQCLKTARRGSRDCLAATMYSLPHTTQGQRAGSWAVTRAGTEPAYA
jgi:hypothetical protein